MRSRPASVTAPSEVEELARLIWAELTQANEWTSFERIFNRLNSRAIELSLPFDPRFNAIHWAFDVHRLLWEISYSFCLMDASAQHYKRRVPHDSQPSHVDFLVSYHADNCITRLDSARDKLALMVWSFYCPFNPEKRPEIPDYIEVLKRLRFPLRYGLKLQNSEVFLRELATLDGKEFDRIRQYRNLKTHRREPRIEIHGAAGHHDWSYMIPLYEKAEIARFEKELERLYPDEQLREVVSSGCYVDGVLFDQRKLKDRVWSYKGIRKNSLDCLHGLLRSSRNCYRILANRRPFR